MLPVSEWGSSQSSDAPHPHHLAQRVPPIDFENDGANARGRVPPDPRDSAGNTRTTTSEDDVGEFKGVGSEPDGADLEKSQLPSTVSGPPADDYPDGGWRAWSVVAGAWCISFTSWGYSNSFGVFQTYYANHQLSEYTSSDISWIGSFQLAMVLACAILAGKAFDAGYIKYLLCGALVFYAAGLFGLANATQYWQIFLSQGVACGLAAGIAFLPAASSVSHWFRRRRATALGFLATGSSVGGIVYPIMQNRMFQSVGFQWTVRAVGFLTIALVAIAALTVNSRLPPRKISNIFDFSPLRERSFALFVAGECLIMLGLYVPYFYIQDYGLAHGVSPNVTEYSLAILNGASVFGRILPNWLADTWGPLTILTPHCYLSGICMFLFIPMCKSEAGLIVFAVLFGFASGAYVSMMPATTASLTKDMRQLGHRTALLFLVVSLFALTGTPISGALVTRDPTYRSSLFCAGAFVFAGSFLNTVTWWVVSKEKGARWV